MNYHIGLCKAPCAGYINKEDYGEIIKSAVELLTGKDKVIKDDLKRKMEIASEALEFEKAVIFRDKIMAIDKINEKQKIVIGNCENEDFISLYVDEKDVCIQVFFLRDGMIVGREHFILNDEAEQVPAELIEEFIKRFYGGAAFIPKTIYVPFINEFDIL